MKTIKLLKRKVLDSGKENLTHTYGRKVPVPKGFSNNQIVQSKNPNPYHWASRVSAHGHQI